MKGYILVVLMLLVGCSSQTITHPDPSKVPAPLASQTDHGSKVGSLLIVTSPSFTSEQPIPEKYSCDGGNISPALKLTGLPVDTVTVALVMDDPDAPSGDWIHWVVWNIPPGDIEEGILPPGSVEGLNSWGQNGYGGPCPPSGRHRYFFKVFALDKALDIQTGSTAQDLLSAIEDHVLDSAEVYGTYTR